MIVCCGLLVAGIAMVVTGFKVVPREPPGMPPAQLVIDGKHDLGGSCSPRIRVRKDRLVRGILMIAAAVIAGVAVVSYSLQHMKLNLSGSWFPGN